MTSTTPHFASLKHRLIAMVYEAILLFGIFFSADFVFDVITQSLDQSALRHWRQLYLFMMVGLYFTYFWRHGGQTLPMQTWRIKVVSAVDQQPITIKQAWMRYCLAWMWVLPAWGVNYWFDIQLSAGVGISFIGLVIWALLSKLNKHSQFMHDQLAGTWLVTTRTKTIKHQHQHN